MTVSYFTRSASKPSAVASAVPVTETVLMVPPAPTDKIVIMRLLDGAKPPNSEPNTVICSDASQPVPLLVTCA